jgi:dsRNA-specific ribonuclease
VQPKYDVEREFGPAHAKQFEIKLTLGDEVYRAIGTSINRAKQSVAEIALNSTKFEKPSQEQLKRKRAGWFVKNQKKKERKST